MVPTNTLAAFRGPPTLSGILCPTSTIRGERAGGVGLSMLQQEVNRGAKHVGAGRSGSLTSVLLTAAILFSLNPFGGPVGAAQDLSGTPLEKSGATIEIVGDARIVDGDTIVIQDGKGGKERIRLLGIDAPESKQVCKDGKGGDYACGIESQQALQKLVGNDKVKCLAAKRDMYQRILGVCYDARTGVELNKAMVDEGEAIAYTAYSKAYATEEETAKSKRTGVWRGEFQKPWEYRKMKRSAARDAKTVQVKKTPKAAVAPASSNVDDGPDDAEL